VVQTHTYTHTLNRTTVYEGSACFKDLYLTTYNTHTHKHTHTQTHTHTLDRTTVYEGSACFKDLYLTTYNTQSTATAGFKTPVPIILLPRNHKIDREATVIGLCFLTKTSPSPAFLILQTLLSTDFGNNRRILLIPCFL
jgi:hypothetical protein